MAAVAETMVIRWTIFLTIINLEGGEEKWQKKLKYQKESNYLKKIV